MPLKIDIRSDRLDELARALSKGRRKALRSAFASEGFRLARLAKQEVREGVGDERAPLSRKIRPAGGAKALTWLAPLIGYSVTAFGAGWQLVVGPGGQKKRKRRPPSKEAMQSAVSGGQIIIDRAKQQSIRARLKRRRKNPPRDLARKKTWGIPGIGDVLESPERDWVTPLADRERRRTAAEIARKYVLKLQGKRF